MIKYKLQCKNCYHCFDSWFSSSKEYEKLKKNKHINCIKCNSLNIKKSLMAPNIVTSKKEKPKIEKNKKNLDIKKRLKEYQKFIQNNFEYVGKNFAYEARTIHYENKKNSKGIYGHASAEDISNLKDEGIETLTIPWFKDREN